MEKRPEQMSPECLCPSPEREPRKSKVQGAAQRHSRRWSPADPLGRVVIPDCALKQDYHLFPKILSMMVRNPTSGLRTD
ncbi:uncharacterized protein LOC125127088 isoform X3 [Phacochoerus africanus]|uniref:uncharacterized protein LOC125127088 isoform X3 n=1 Tax=Phacochoerus africanus TaxID=41426 RepID=UPI001FDAB6C6|nr:uncharacterized protein LOC125127088 isoform X3 [Phacochoerus africanus]